MPFRVPRPYTNNIEKLSSVDRIKQLKKRLEKTTLGPLKPTTARVLAVASKVPKSVHLSKFFVLPPQH